MRLLTKFRGELGSVKTSVKEVKLRGLRVFSATFDLDDVENLLDMHEEDIVKFLVLLKTTMKFKTGELF